MNAALRSAELQFDAGRFGNRRSFMPEVIAQQPRGHPRDLGALARDAGLSGLVAVKLLVSEFARVRATPSLGGETAQHARPAAACGFVADWVQSGVERGNRTPGANKSWFRKWFERVSEKDAKMPLIRRSKLD